jgi:MFS transporter, MHS family, citrate/tricarballylate:H+ symporter
MIGEERKAKIGAIVRVSSGNFLEMYDFIIFGYYAAALGRRFFRTAIPLSL